jgi:Zn ribbon nucleic-acid-binding protein
MIVDDRQRYLFGDSCPECSKEELVIYEKRMAQVISVDGMHIDVVV